MGANGIAIPGHISACAYVNCVPVKIMSIKDELLEL